MKTTLKTLSALAIAAATLTAVTLASGSAASANPLNGAHRLPLFRPPPRVLVPRMQPSAPAPDVELQPLALSSMGL